MENFINNVKNVVSLDVLIYIVIALVAIVILTIIMMVLRQKQARKQLDELELSYNSLKGIPLAFKLNKAVALSRVNEEMSQRVESCRTDFDNIQEQLKECSVTLAEADDLIYVHKAKAAKRRMEKLREQMAELEGVAKDVNQALDSILVSSSAISMRTVPPSPRAMNIWKWRLQVLKRCFQPLRNGCLRPNSTRPLISRRKYGNLSLI